MPAKIKRGFNLGGPVAESDPLLAEAFYDNGDYSAIASRDDDRRFIIGRTGSGKSAAFEHLSVLEAEHVARVAPQDLSLTYISNLGVVRQLTDLGVRLDIFFTALWKHIIIVELLRHRYPMATAQAKQNVVAALMEKFNRDPVKRRAIEYLDSFGDKFWCDADERVRQIAEGFETKVKAAGEIGSSLMGAKASAGAETTEYSHQRREEAAKFQRVVNEIQLPRLNEMIRLLGEEILESDQHYTYLIIDDLDREWADDDIEQLVIRCLFQTVVDIQRVKNLKVLVALRTNIFLQLSYSRLDWGQQSEKFRALALDMHWTRNDLEALLQERVKAACGRFRINPPKSLDEFLPSGRQNGYSPFSYIIERTLLRPRDAIVYLNICFREAVGKERIPWEVIVGSEREYSQERLFALRDEWSDPFPGLQRAFELFRGSKPRMSRAEFTQILDEVVLLWARPNFEGLVWITQLCHQFIETSATPLSWYEWYRGLVRLLFNIGFIGCSPSHQTPLVYAYEDPLYAGQENNFPEDSTMGVHPAFRASLGIENAQKGRTKAVAPSA